MDAGPIPIAVSHASQGEGDTVVARVLPDQPGKVVIDKIEGDNGRLSLVAAENCVGIAAIETLKLTGQPSCGVGLTLYKVRRRADGARAALLPAAVQQCWPWPGPRWPAGPWLQAAAADAGRRCVCSLFPSALSPVLNLRVRVANGRGRAAHPAAGRVPTRRV
jgi:hypothetical protein